MARIKRFLTRKCFLGDSVIDNYVQRSKIENSQNSKFWAWMSISSQIVEIWQMRCLQNLKPDRHKKLFGTFFHKRHLMGGLMCWNLEVTNQDGGRPPYWKNKNCNNFAAVWDIFTKFDGHVDLLFPEFLIVPNMTIDKIQDGGMQINERRSMWIFLIEILHEYVA